jgi:hypothetical protein
MERYKGGRGARQRAKLPTIKLGSKHVLSHSYIVPNPDRHKIPTRTTISYAIHVRLHVAVSPLSDIPILHEKLKHFLYYKSSRSIH